MPSVKMLCVVCLSSPAHVFQSPCRSIVFVCVCVTFPGNAALALGALACACPHVLSLAAFARDAAATVRARKLLDSCVCTSVDTLRRVYHRSSAPELDRLRACAVMGMALAALQLPVHDSQRLAAVTSLLSAAVDSCSAPLAVGSVSESVGFYASLGLGALAQKLAVVETLAFDSGSTPPS